MKPGSVGPSPRLKRPRSTSSLAVPTHTAYCEGPPDEAIHRPRVATSGSTFSLRASFLDSVAPSQTKPDASFAEAPSVSLLAYLYCVRLPSRNS